MMPELYVEKDPPTILTYFGEIISLSNSERNALGFLPERAIREGINRGKLLILLDRSFCPPKFVGYLLYSGVFPYAKVQQLATILSYRKKGAASTLICALVTKLESLGFMSIRADIASDLHHALEFYRKHDFAKIKSQAGGISRNREILLHLRELNTDTLFTRKYNQDNDIDLGIRERSAREVAFFALDLNVYFDLARDRSQSQSARQLFGAALAHSVRLMVADEFVEELRRTSHRPSEDPILQLALRLPRMPRADARQLTELQKEMHNLIFAEGRAQGAGSNQALSDAGHLAHAALARASAFVTRDRAILDMQEALLHRFGIDVLTVDELLMTLPSDAEQRVPSTRYGYGFICAPTTASALRRYMQRERLPLQAITQFARDDEHSEKFTRLAITRDGEVVACGIMVEPKAPKATCQLFVHARQQSSNTDMYIDHLLETLLREATTSGSVAITLRRVEGLPSLTATARARGFTGPPSASTLVKVALGRPVTTASWGAISHELMLRTGLRVPTTLPAGDMAGRFAIKTRQGSEIILSLMGLEYMLSPALLIRPDQRGVIVPIARRYSELLFGDNKQFSLAVDDDKDATFFSSRAYVNTPRAANSMRPGSPILFYESRRNGGTGGIVAIGRIVETEITSKEGISDDSLRRVVVDGVDNVSSTGDVLVTKFSDIFKLPQPVLFRWLKENGCVDGTNLITARVVSGEMVQMIVDRGWGYGSH